MPQPPQNRLPRARCPVCRGDIALRKGGLVREHKDQRHELYRTGRNDEVPICPGSGLDIADSKVQLALFAPTRTEELHAFVRRLVGAAKSRLLDVLIEQYPDPLTKDELAERADASATSSSFTNNLGSLRSLGLIDYPQPGYVHALPILFLEESRA